MRQWAENIITHWMDRRYGAPTDPSRQYRFYRCCGCRRLITWKQIRLGGCSCRLSLKMVPARLTKLDKFRILVLPFTIGRMIYEADEPVMSSGRKWA